MLLPGDPAPTFVADTSAGPQFHLNAIAGRYVVVCLFGSAANLFAASVLAEIDARHERFDGGSAVLLAVSVDPADRSALAQHWPGVIYVWDADGAVSRLFDAIVDAPPTDAAGTPAGTYRPRTVVLDPALRVVAVIPFEPVRPRSGHVEQVLQVLDAQPPPDALAFPAPVLLIPHVFEPALVQQLTDYYDARGGQPSGFMREVDGRTVPVVDPGFKRRADCEVTDPDLIRATQERLARRVAPAMRQAFQFNPTRIERHIVGCYDAADAGHFKPHRDNTTRGTAHRRFAVSINLNTEEFVGGELRFPEFGHRTHKPPRGWAVVFSCSLLHEVTPVTAGRRLAFLPFLYDEAAAALRERNRQFVAPPVGAPAVSET